MIDQSDLSGKVSLAGAVRQEEIRAYYRRAWVFALPCVDAPDGNRDGIPNVLMEAMASGVPVIATANSGQAELIGTARTACSSRVHSPDRSPKPSQPSAPDGGLRATLAASARKRILDDLRQQEDDRTAGCAPTTLRLRRANRGSMVYGIPSGNSERRQKNRGAFSGPLLVASVAVRLAS